jgi:hypothetical protein
VDALALRSDEGRGKLRKASGSGTHTLIRRYPNGETHQLLVPFSEYIAVRSERGEVKHLSTLRKRNQFRDYPSSGERTGKSLNLIHLFEAGVVGPQCAT